MQSADFFITYSFGNTIRVSNGLDPEHDRSSVVGPGIGPNCLQRYSKDKKVTASKEIINIVRIKSEHNNSGRRVLGFFPPGALGCFMVYGPRREKPCFRGFANNQDADQPAHLRSLISALVIRFLESVISELATSEISFF